MPSMSSRSETHAPVVTLAALYGAAGTVIGPQVAERLGVPFLDRAIPQGAARRVGRSDEAVVTSTSSLGPRSSA